MNDWANSPYVKQQLGVQNLINKGYDPKVAAAMVAGLRGGTGPSQAPAPATPVSQPQPAPQVVAPSPPQVVAPSTPSGAMGPPQSLMGTPAPSPGSGRSPSIFDNADAVDTVLGMGEQNRQLAQAEAMRDQDFARGRSVSNGRMYVAAAPLEHIATTASKMKGKRDSSKIGSSLAESRKTLIDLLREKKEDSPSLGVPT